LEFASCPLPLAPYLYIVPGISIAVKNAIVYFILLVLTSAILGYSIYRISSNKILDNATLSLNHNNESVVTQFRVFLKDIQRNITFMSRNPFLYQFISDTSNEGLKSKLSGEFLALLSTNKHFLQLRLIGEHNSGKEIIRAEKFGERFALVDEKNLQQKGDRDYFIETIKLPEDSIYYSEINLNQEYGKIIMPMVPTMRMATPIYVDGKPFGIIVVNVDLSYVFDELKRIAGSQYTLSLFNNEGYYLIHPDSSLIFGFEFRQAPAIDILQTSKNGMDFKFNKEADDKLYSIRDYSYPKPGYHLFFSLSADKNVLLSVFNQWRSDIILLTIIMTLLSLVVAFWWTRRQMKEFKSITNNIISFGKNPENIQLQIDRNDEIGDLSKSFREMADKIKLHLRELEIAKTEAVEANKAKQEFLENMSHEIRNPLQSILGMTGMLSQNNPRPDQQVFIETLKFSSENLLTLVNDILDYRKLIHGQIELNEQEIGIKEYLDNIIKSHLFDATNKKVKLSLKMDSSLVNKNLFTDPVRLSQILHNLLSNAIRNCVQGKEVILEFKSLDHEKIQFSIIDQGLGISKENIQNILQQKPVTGDSKQTQNVGLGLPIVINLLKLFNSNLQIESIPGTGSSFTFQLVSKLTDVKQRVAIQQESVSFLDAYLPHVACIEDDLQNAFFYEQLFEKIGINIDTFHSPDAFNTKNDTKYNLVISDVNFMDSHLRDHLHNYRQSIQDKGILILISAADDNNLESDGHNQLYDKFVIKPVSAEHLLNELSNLVFEKHFEKPVLDNVFLNYDYQPEKLIQVLELMIREWKEMFTRFLQAIQKRDLELWDKVYHKLINSMRMLELYSLQKGLNEMRDRLQDPNYDINRITHYISLPFASYIRIFNSEMENRKAGASNGSVEI
jgi:signal transduction histidine kinase/DNA-binding response OmpR family regulator